MPIQKMIEELSLKPVPTESNHSGTVEVVSFFRCLICQEQECLEKGSLCNVCKKEKELGYQILSMLGRLRNEFQRDSGTRFHAVRFDSYKAICGAEPGRRSVGWSLYHGEEVTCPRCLKKLKKHGEEKINL
jgi:hypothetical protein